MSLEVLDSFVREHENPVGGEWITLPWVSWRGEVHSATYGWVATSSPPGETGVAGIYWPTTIKDPHVEFTFYTEPIVQYQSIWLCLDAAHAHQGYEVRWKGNGVSCGVYKWTAGTPELLGETHNLGLGGGEVGFCLVGASCQGGKIKVYAEGALAFEVADSTYNNGYVGLEGDFTPAYFPFGVKQFRAGETGGSPPVIEKPADIEASQHSILTGFPIKVTGSYESLSLKQAGFETITK